VSEYLKQQNSKVRCVLADPPGSSLYEYVKNGALKSTGSGSITEGIGIGRVTANMATAKIDDAVHIEDPETVTTVYRLLHEDGLFLGSTSGINVAAAVRVARQLGPGHVIVTVLCDGGAKYQSRLFNPEWLAQKNLARAAAVAPSERTPITLEKALVAWTYEARHRHGRGHCRSRPCGHVPGFRAGIARSASGAHRFAAGHRWPVHGAVSGQADL
jgi:hypothetical protein